MMMMMMMMMMLMLMLLMMMMMMTAAWRATSSIEHPICSILQAYEVTSFRISKRVFSSVSFFLVGAKSAEVVCASQPEG